MRSGEGIVQPSFMLNSKYQEIIICARKFLNSLNSEYDESTI